MFSLPAQGRGSTYILGVPGSGKSVLLAHLALDSAEAGCGMLVIDPHAQLTEYLLYSVPPERADDVIYLDARSLAYPFGINPFELRTEDELELSRVSSSGVHLFKLLMTLDKRDKTFSWGPRMAQLFAMSIETLAMLRLTMTEFLDLLLNEELRSRWVHRLPQGEQKRFWELEFSRLGKSGFMDVVGPVTNKVRPLVKFSFMQHILGQQRSTVRMDELMDAGKIVLVPLPAGVLGEDVAALLGSILVGQVLSVVLSRQDNPRKKYRPFHVYADEFQLVATEDVVDLITQGRKFGVDVVGAHQIRDMLDDVTKQATLAMQNQIYGRVTGKDAAELALQLDRTPPPGELVPRPTMVWAGDSLVQAETGYGRNATRLYHLEEGNRRTYADMGGERANQLVTLPPYRFLTRVRDGGRYRQEVIDTNPAPGWDEEPTEEQQQRAEVIKERSRALYGREASEVARVIQDRRVPAPPPPVETALVETPPSPKEKQRGRVPIKTSRMV